MVTRIILSAAALVFIGCGSHPQQQPDAHEGDATSPPSDSPVQPADAPADTANPTSLIARSGSRLKLAWDVTSDGVRVPHEAPFEFFDAERDEECVRQQWSDDSMRCTPYVSNNAGLLYADSACTVPVIQGSLTQPPSQPYWIQGAPGTVTKIEAFYSRGPELTTYPTQVWQRVNTTCTSPIDVGTGPHPFRLYAAVAIAGPSFVELTTVTDAGSDPLEAVKYTSPDGLLWPLDRAYSSAVSAECSLVDTPYVPTAATCGSATLARGYDSTGSTRLRQIDLTYPPSFVHYDHFLYDTVLGTECAFGDDIGSAVSLCRPYPTAQTRSLYADPSCTTAIDVIQLNPPATPPAYAVRAGQLHHVGAQHVATLYWGGPGPSCEQYTNYEVPPTTLFYEIDPAVIDASQLASAAIVVDP